MTGLTRRDFLAGAATAAGALAVGGRAAAAPATFDGTLRVLGLSAGQAAYDLPEPILKQAEHDLGFPDRQHCGVSLRHPAPCSSGARHVRRLLLLRPGHGRILGDRQPPARADRQAAALEGASRRSTRSGRRCRAAPAARTARATPRFAGSTSTRIVPAAGGARRACRRVSPSFSSSGSTSRPANAVGPEPKFLTGSPGTFNFDSFGYNAKVLGKRPEQLSWAELLNSRWRRRVALNGFDPQGSLQDTANAVQAAGSDEVR